MKKSLSALITCLSFIIFSSCSIEPIDDTSTILGEWTLTSWKVETPIDLNNDGGQSLEFSPGCLMDSALNFMDASNGTIFYSSLVIHNTRMEDGKLVFMTACSTESDREPTSLNYIINENVVIIDYDAEEFLLTLNGNTLSMLVPNGFVAKDINTFETTVAQDVTYIFTR